MKIVIYFFKLILFSIFSILIQHSKSLNHYPKFYVTLTSWKGRINSIHKNLKSLLNNSIKPIKMILNLSIEEFPNKNSDLPKTILNLLKKYDNFEIFWVKKDNNVFKKLIPTINRFKKDLIITVDDDLLYPKNFFENILKCYFKLGSKNPVSFGTRYSDWNISNKIINSHFGEGSIVKYDYFNNHLNELYFKITEERLNKGIKWPDDVLYTYAALLNGYKYIRCREYYINIKENQKNPFSEKYNKNISAIYKEYHTIIRKYIKDKYNITVEKII